MTLTLQDIPPEIDEALRQKANAEHRPVDQVAVEAMRAGLGLPTVNPHRNGSGNLAASIRGRFSPLGGIELAPPIREPMPEPLDFGQ